MHVNKSSPFEINFASNIVFCRFQEANMEMGEQPSDFGVSYFLSCIVEPRKTLRTTESRRTVRHRNES